MPQSSDHQAAAAAVAELVSEHDKRFSALDFAGVAELWEHDRPQPIYLGDEYPGPLFGTDELGRHWARVSSRVKAASVSSTVHALDVLDVSDGAVARAVLLSRWRLTVRESDTERSGASWITWLLIRRAPGYRICHHMEAQVYLP